MTCNGFGFGKGRRVIKTIIQGEALQRALERQQRFVDAHPELQTQTTRVRTNTLIWETDPYRKRMAKVLQPRREPR